MTPVTMAMYLMHVALTYEISKQCFIIIANEKLELAEARWL